jgi:hypothetical protein
VQTTGFAPVHVPVWHVSVCVQALPSLQPEPSALGGSEHSPVPVLHVPASWHWSLAVQTTEVPAWQLPDWQVSPSVQALPSLQPDPSALGGSEHSPVPALHVPASWHWSLAVQTTAVPAWQLPDWQLSPSVQALPSVQPVPFVAFGFVQTPVPMLQVPATWH